MRARTQTPKFVMKLSRVSMPVFLTRLYTHVKFTYVCGLKFWGPRDAPYVVGVCFNRIGTGGIYAFIKPLPADAGRIGSVMLDVLKYRLIVDRATCGAEIATSPEMPPPIFLSQFGELHLNLT